MNTAFSKCFWYLQKQYPNTMTADIVYRIPPGFSSHSPMQIFITANIPATIHIPFSHRKNTFHNTRKRTICRIIG